MKIYHLYFHFHPIKQIHTSHMMSAEATHFTRSHHLNHYQNLKSFGFFFHQSHTHTFIQFYVCIHAFVVIFILLDHCCVSFRIDHFIVFINYFILYHSLIFLSQFNFMLSFVKIFNFNLSFFL